MDNRWKSYYVCYMIIENISLNPGHPYYLKDHHPLKRKYCDKLNRMDPHLIFRYLDEINRICRECSTVLYVEILLEWSSDPIGSLTKCPAMGKWDRSTIQLGAMFSSLAEHYKKYRAVSFVGYHDKPNNKVVSHNFA